MSKDVSGSITLGGTAQTLTFSGVVFQGFGIYNPDPSNDLWISDSTTAAPNAVGSIRVPSNGGWYETPQAYEPNTNTISIYGAVTAQKFTAKQW